MKTYLELTSAALEAAREISLPGLPQADMLDELRRDPLAWYRKGLQAVADGTQRATKLVETNAQIVARNAEHFQAFAERTAKEIESAGNTYVNRMREIYSR
jgi:predicted membrane-bound mannosyltransferase